MNTFEEWFGRSKIVDDEGAPLLAFHGTKEVFKEFRTPAWFSDMHSAADGFSAELGDGYRTADSKVVAVYLSFQHPFLTDDWGVTEGKAYDKEWVASLIAEGYDSIIFQDDGETEFIAFHPEQIMMANHPLAPESEFKHLDVMSQGRLVDDTPCESMALQGVRIAPWYLLDEKTGVRVIEGKDPNDHDNHLAKISDVAAVLNGDKWVTGPTISHALKQISTRHPLDEEGQLFCDSFLLKAGAVLLSGYLKASEFNPALTKSPRP